MRRLVTAAVVCLCAIGCATPALITADITYYSVSPPVQRGAAVEALTSEPAPGCLFVVDSRRSTMTSGWSFPKPQIKAWLVDGLQARLGVDVEYLDAPPPERPYLALETVYIKHIATSMAGVTVLRAHTSDGAEAFRGNKTRMNWNATDTEFSRVLSQSLDTAIVKLPLDKLLRNGCQSAAVASAGGR